jgi:hypothetical protein
MSASSDRAATPADYRLLGVPVGVGTEELKAAYKQLARKLHPDANPGDPGAEARFKQLQQAFWAVRDNPMVERPRAQSPARPTAPIRRPVRPSPQRAAPRPVPSGPPRPATMAPGDVLWIEPGDLLVAPDRHCYLDPAATGSVVRMGGRTLEVIRTPEGHVVRIPAGIGHRWSISKAARTGLAVVEVLSGESGMRWRHGPDPLLPHRLIEATVGNIPLGARRFSVAAALRVDPSGRVWLDKDESVSNEPGITTPVRIELFGDGFHVHSDIPFKRWQGPAPRGPQWVEASVASLGGTVVRTAGTPLSA